MAEDNIAQIRYRLHVLLFFTNNATAWPDRGDNLTVFVFKRQRVRWTFPGLNPWDFINFWIMIRRKRCVLFDVLSLHLPILFIRFISKPCMQVFPYVFQDFVDFGSSRTLLLEN